MVDQKSLALPWITESDLPYGEQPRIYDTTGALIAVVGNAEIDKQDDWERNASAIVQAVNAAGNPVVADNATCKPALQVAISSAIPGEVAELVERLRNEISAQMPHAVKWGVGEYGTLPPYLKLADEAATALTSLAARVEALEAGLGEREKEVEKLTKDFVRKHEAFVIASDQAMSNGSAFHEAISRAERAESEMKELQQEYTLLSMREQQIGLSLGVAESSLAEREAEMGRMAEALAELRAIDRTHAGAWLSSDVRRSEAEAQRDKLRKYAHEATKAITDLAGGGSENFDRELDGIYTADLAFCVERIRARFATAKERATRTGGPHG